MLLQIAYFSGSKTLGYHLANFPKLRRIVKVDFKSHLTGFDRKYFRPVKCLAIKLVKKASVQNSTIFNEFALNLMMVSE